MKIDERGRPRAISLPLRQVSIPRMTRLTGEDRLHGGSPAGIDRTVLLPIPMLRGYVDPDRHVESI